MIEVSKLSHHYGGFLGPNDLWTPEEIDIETPVGEYVRIDFWVISR